MTSAYNETFIYNLAVIKETKQWYKNHFIERQQFDAIAEAYKTPLYHPNFMIRILLFVATLFALGGVTGLLFLFVGQSGENGILVACTMYGIASFVFLELVFLKNHHYKSGVAEALLYHACGYTIVGIAGLFDFDNIHVTLWACFVTFSFAAIRYLDLLTTVAAILTFAGILFFEFYSMEGIFQQIIPFVFIVAFSGTYFFAKRLRARQNLRIWRNNLLIVEAASLIFLYIGGNYLIVRELSVNMMSMQLEPGEDIPFSFIFYATTVLIPCVFLCAGVRNKDIVLLRVSLIVIAFSVFTFKYYYSLGHPEITLTAAGIILIGVSIALLNYLKVMRHGFTRENLLSEKWGNMNAEAFIISQTMGGNQVNVATGDVPGGGSFGGGGATTDF